MVVVLGVGPSDETISGLSIMKLMSLLERSPPPTCWGRCSSCGEFDRRLLFSFAMDFQKSWVLTAIGGELLLLLIMEGGLLFWLELSIPPPPDPMLRLGPRETLLDLVSHPPADIEGLVLPFV